MQPIRRRHGFPLLSLFAALLAAATLLPVAAVAEGVRPSEARQLRDEVKDMFYHAFDGYMKYAFPLDELRPLSCQGEDSLGGYAFTLIDSLDTLALLGDKEKFGAAVEWVGKNVRFDIITSTAAGGTLTLEFGILSRLTNNTVFERVTKKISAWNMVTQIKAQSCWCPYKCFYW